MTIWISEDRKSVVDSETCPEGFEEFVDNPLQPPEPTEMVLPSTPLTPDFSAPDYSEKPNDSIV